MNGVHPIIELKNLHFGYNSRPVVNDASLTVHAGDRIGLVGSNGSGKTTLCHIIMGLLIPQSGEVALFGRPCRTEEDFRKVRGRLGFLFQDSDDQLFCPTVLEDVAFGPLNLGKSPHQAMEIASRTLKALDMDGLGERLTHQLSGGEKRLVSLATILAMEPEALILDEPSSGLDEETMDRICDILNSSDLTYLVISHDKEFLDRTTNVRLTMRRGKITHG